MSKIYSMTGFGRAEASNEHCHAKVEISSVNRKNGEVVVQLPKSLLILESDLRKIILSRIQRGRIQVFLSVTPTSAAQGNRCTLINRERLLAFMAAVKEIEEITGYPQRIELSEIIRTGDILNLQEPELDAELVFPVISAALNEALNEVLKMRLSEGEHLRSDICNRIDTLEHEVKTIAALAPNVQKYYRENLLRRLKDNGLHVDLDDERILKEIGIFADRCDLSEEITRLHSHFLQFRNYLNASEPVGRSLDFLCQELNRELNTIGSKANDALITKHVVICKAELEKVREQIQNIE
jgi:uncharacterized protein (TIGR00255 family)